MPAGRPTKMTDAVVAKLEAAFMMGCTDEEACLYADIDRATLARYEKKFPQFRDRKWVLKSNPVMKARGVVLDALEKNDIATAHKVIDRKEGSKVALTGADGDAIKTITTIEYVIRKDPPN